jgi:hypothetical protein
MIQTEINELVCTRILGVVDYGLCKGLGEPVPGNMCVEAAINYAFSNEHSDDAHCESQYLREFKISINDLDWSSNESRAKGLRRLAIASLGTDENFDGEEFKNKQSRLLISKYFVNILKFAARRVRPEYKSSILRAALRCERYGTEQEAEYVWSTYQYTFLEAGVRIGVRSTGYTVNHEPLVTIGSIARAWKHNLATEFLDELLSEYAEDMVQILIKMKTPGSKYLYLTELPADNVIRNTIEYAHAGVTR